MKTTLLTAVTLLLLTTSVIAQDPPDITVLEKSWSREARRRELDPSKQNPNALTRHGVLPRETLEERARKEPQPGFVTVTRHTIYVYKIKAMNTGLKTIKRLYWRYQFIDPDTQRTWGTQMVSSKKLSPGKTVVFKAETVQPPVPFFLDIESDKKYQLKFTEQLVIDRIDYTDGSVWTRP